MIRSTIILFAGTIFLACLLTPPIFSLLSLYWENFPYPFSRVFDRVAMLLAALLILFLRKDFRPERIRTLYSIGNWPNRIGYFLGGLIICLSLSISTLPVVVGTGDLLWTDAPTSRVIQKGLVTIPAAVLISIIEETFFRGLLLLALLDKFKFWQSAVLSSILYAVVHFIAPVKGWQYPGWHPFVGFEYITEVFARYTEPGIIYAVFGLLLVGLTLCYAYRKSRSLYLCIGMHTGWVIAVKLSFLLTATAPGVVVSSGPGRRYFLVAEPLVWISIMLVFAALYLASDKMFEDRAE
jgi:uncharacterized protein